MKNTRIVEDESQSNYVKRTSYNKTNYYYNYYNDRAQTILTIIKWI